VKVTVTGNVVVFVSVPLILPLPEAAMPVAATVLSRVQLNTVPLTAPLNVMAVIALPEQMVWEVGTAVTVGVGFTSTVAVVDEPAQPLAVVVMVNVTVIGALVVLVSTPAMLP
jgi:hypothetical protein